MLSNEDLAELLESTRDRVKLMGGDAPTAVGVVVALNGLITMLRDEVVTDDTAEDEQADYAAPSRYAAPEPEPEAEAEPAPEPQRRIPNRVRRQQQEQTKPANPLLSDQYAGFFNKLIADQKPQPRESDEIAD